VALSARPARPGCASNSELAIKQHAESTDRNIHQQRLLDPRTRCYQLSQEPFLGVMAFNFEQFRRRGNRSLGLTYRLLKN